MLGEEKRLISRAAKRADLAEKALATAAGDLQGASDANGSLDGLVEVVEDEAAVVGRLADHIESRLDDGDGQAASAGKRGGAAKRP